MIAGQSFQNKEGSRITSFVSPNADVELDTITIYDTYPKGELGKVWAKNEHSAMLVRLSRGSGRLALRQTIDGEVHHEVADLSSRSAVYIPQSQWYAYESYPGGMMIDAVFVPPFDESQHSIKTEATLLQEEKDAS